MNTLPTLTTEQRRDNLERAKAARHARAELRRDMKSGNITVSDAISDPRAQRLYVRQFLASIPGIAQKRAEKIMCRLGIAPNRRVHGLGNQQRAELLSLFDNVTDVK